MSEARTTATAPKKRHRRKPETAMQRMARLELELKGARKAATLEQERAFAIVGKAVVAEAADNAELKATLAAVLRKRVKGNTAKAAVAGWMLEPNA